MIASRRLIAFVLPAIALISASACNNAAKIAEYTAKAQQLVTTYSPQVAQLQTQLPDLLTRAGAIPDEVPGASDVKTALGTSQETLAKLQSLLVALPDQVANLIKERKTEEADAALASATQALETGLSEAQAHLGTATAQIAELEAKAIEMAGFTKALSSGFEVKGATDGLESQLVAFLDDSAQPIDKTKWFTCDKLVFRAEAPELDTEQSSGQVTNIAEILKAYPTAKLTIGGFTDNTGTAAANKALSKKRADAVVAALVAAGAPKDRLVAEGQGPENPVCAANDTEECKAQNHRIAVNVRSR